MSMTNQRRKILWIVLGVVGLVGMGGIGIFRLVADRIFNSQTANLTPKEFSDWVKLQIPPTVRNWKAYGQGFQDWYIQVRFELPAEELSAFLKANGLVPINFNQSPENLLKQSWFSPKPPFEVYQLKSSQTKQASTASGFYPTVYVEQHGSNVVVYIAAFNT